MFWNIDDRRTEWSSIDNRVQIRQVEQLDEEVLHGLSSLLMDIVNDNASIGFLPPLDRKMAEDYWAEVLQPGMRLWIAVVNGQVCGTIQLHLAQKPNALHRAEVAKLMVHPSQRRMGIAKGLLRIVEDCAHDEARSLLVLDTREGDPSNLLYHSNGYIEAGRIPEFAKSADGSYHATVIYYKKL
ncbi:GNAT family N-acetyltransferase [Paenibacillus alvei]|uniref:GNAT family N-acetyltransferase n=1 Tax=Paenibacillus alvei TaxID=44250 RepID=A0ABT4GTX2_PAEAL|nr:GNAT family N-acetyltransferase [Paenibacillus alvei]EJW16362.1 acetyltransferase Ttr [Paenibacillus alvei DSM 29]MCY7483112.1 GNAT family N-acetyltransferase [Paenibacillus alvei]MCY9543064.1 GNAT family N-acetyltransferase [Paenibacillus alvei]MCY9707839.1 GNAT family N-acetyltransferase [Paenibacillus alvei]MCY9736308.1 GNAT family N-acetyltransferase [Paenibacillus alvei]